MSGGTDGIKGRVKEAAGDLTGDKDLQREGKKAQAAGKINNKAQDAENSVGGKVDDVKNLVGPGGVSIFT